MVRAWCYGDNDGSQISYGVQFAYGHREHTLLVLIDQLLGGAVKDTWFDLDSEPGRARQRFRQLVSGHPTAAFFREIAEPETLNGLREALACPHVPSRKTSSTTSTPSCT